MAGNGPLDGFARVVQQMPPVGDLDGQRRARSCALGVTAGPVPADDLCARVGIQPGTEGFRGPLGQHIDRTAGLDAGQDGPVDVPPAQREVINPRYQRCLVIGVSGGADEPQQRRPAHRAGQPPGQPGAGPAGQGQRDRLQHAPQLEGPPPVTDGQARHLLRERLPGAPPAAAQEPAHLQVNAHLPAAAGGIGQLPPVTAVHPPRHRAAVRAGSLAAAGPGQHMHRLADHGYALDRHAGEVRDQRGESLKTARRS
jgi:hypothetical protein